MFTSDQHVEIIRNRSILSMTYRYMSLYYPKSVNITTIIGSETRNNKLFKCFVFYFKYKITIMYSL